MGVPSAGVAATPEHVEIVKKYVALRKQKNTQGTLALVSDDISFYSQRDGSFKGTKAFTEYLEKTKIEGTWSEPAIEDADDGTAQQHVVVRGVVKIYYIPISVKSTFTFNEAGLICSITTSKA